MTLLRVFIGFWLTMLFGFGLGFIVGVERMKHRQPPATVTLESPLKVTIIDDGGAKLKVESTVEEAK